MASYCQILAEQGFLLTHWEMVRDLWIEALRSSPYIEAYELQNMELGIESAAYRFFTLHVVNPMSSAIEAMEDVYDDPANARVVSRVSSNTSCLFLFSDECCEMAELASLWSYPGRPRLCKYFNKYGVSDHICRLGFRESLPTLYFAAAHSTRLCRLRC